MDSSHEYESIALHDLNMIQHYLFRADHQEGIIDYPLFIGRELFIHIDQIIMLYNLYVQ